MRTGIVLILILAAGCFGGTIYVDCDAPGGNNGSSWTDAYNYLQDALVDAGLGDQIFVAQGIYRPDENSDNPAGTGDRGVSFKLKNGVAVMGGYAGYGETDPDVRDFFLYEAILSGDLNEDDGPGTTNKTDNSAAVVTGHSTNNTAVLEGFTVTGGYQPGGHGGGLWIQSGSPTVLSCTFLENISRWGPGITNKYSCPTIINCFFISNLAYDHGGGLDNVWNSSPLVQSCVFMENQAGNHGGAISNDQSCSPSIMNCTIYSNFTSGLGGGIYNIAYSYPSVTNTILWNNSDHEGTDFDSQFYGGEVSKIKYSCIQGWDDSMGQESNIGDDPLLDADGYHLTIDSPCINAGDPEYVVQEGETDIDGETRIADGRLEIGADEVDVGGTAKIEFMVDYIVGKKEEASAVIELAMSKEAELLDAIDEFLNGDKAAELDNGAAERAINRIELAFKREQKALEILSQSIEQLQEALAILKGDQKGFEDQNTLQLHKGDEPEN